MRPQPTRPPGGVRHFGRTNPPPKPRSIRGRAGKRARPQAIGGTNLTHESTKTSNDLPARAANALEHEGQCRSMSNVRGNRKRNVLTRCRSSSHQKGGRSPHARPRAVRCRHPAARNEGRRLRPQPGRARPPSRHFHPGGTSRHHVHRGGARRREADPRGVGLARIQGIGAAAARHRQGASCRRAGSHVRRRHTGGSRRHCAVGHARSRGIAGRARHAGSTHDRRRPGPRALGRQRISRDLRRYRHRQGVRCTHQGHARDPHRTAMHGTDRRARRCRLLGHAPRAIDAALGLPDAAHRAHRPLRMPGPRRGPGPHHRAGRRRGHSATRASCCRRRSASAGSPCIAAIRCAGSRTVASI